MKNKFHVSEIFDSIEGEGKRTGYMSIFVRLTGCNLRCGYCDTKYAQIMGREDVEMTEEEIVAKIESYPWKKVTLTGGEPLLHDVKSLLHTLAIKNYEVNIETNGAVPLLGVRFDNMFYTMDWKSPSSGENSKMIKENLRKLQRKDVLKFVVGNKEDLDEMRKIVENKDYQYWWVRPLIYVSPVFGEIEPKEIVEYLRENKLRHVCMQVQLHKVIWNPNERGV